MAVVAGAEMGQGLTELQQTGSKIPNKIFVGGLAEQTKEDHIRKAFHEIDPGCPVQNVKIIVDRTIMTKSNEPRRYAFVEFNTENEVKKILDLIAAQNKALDLHNRRLTVGQAYRKAAGQQNGNCGLQHMALMDPMGYYRLAYAANAAAAASYPKAVPVMPGMPCYGYPMAMDPYGMMPAYMMAANSYSVPCSPSAAQVVPPSPMSSSYSKPMYTQNMLGSGMMDSNYGSVGKGNGCVNVDDSGSDMYMFQSPMQNGSGDQRGRSSGRMMSMSHAVQVPQQPPMSPRYVQQSPVTSSPMDSRYLNGTSMQHRPAYA